MAHSPRRGMAAFLALLVGLSLMALAGGLYWEVWLGWSWMQESMHLLVNTRPPGSGAGAFLGVCIPVGGTTVASRLPALRALLEQLSAQGVLPEHVYLFEDVYSRAEAQPDPAVFSLAKGVGVQLVRNHVVRTKKSQRAETGLRFGLSLARHYHQMLEYMFMRQEFPFVLVLEDDLQLGADAVQFFATMATVMQRDESVYCVSGHADNGFPAFVNTHSSANQQQALFDIRRGEHFMAPGWLTSRSVYARLLRGKWFESVDSPALPYQKELGMNNANWDMFLEVMIGYNALSQTPRSIKRECIYPEIPRIAHKGSKGFTVSASAQRDLFEPLSLSSHAPETPAQFDVDGMVLAAYDEKLAVTLDGADLVLGGDAQVLFNPDADRVITTRGMTIVLVLKGCLYDKCRQWNRVLGNQLTIHGVGGHAGHGKQRGVHKGTVMLRWLSHTLVLVAEYSPFAGDLASRVVNIAPRRGYVTKGAPSAVEYELVGCYSDAGDARTLPFLLLVKSGGVGIAKVLIEECVVGCRRKGHSIVGIQNMNECWCGAEGDVKAHILSSGREHTEKQCVSGVGLGAAWKSDVYRILDVPAALLATETLVPPAWAEKTGLQVTHSAAGDDCTNTCALAGLRCEDAFFPWVAHFTMHYAGKLFSSPCDQGYIIDAKDTAFVFAAPGMQLGSSKCYSNSYRYASCSRQAHMFRRLCPCLPK